MSPWEEVKTAAAPEVLVDRSRILRESAVSLIRASDLSALLAAKRIEEVIAELQEIVIDLHADSRLEVAFIQMGRRG